jgi:hypothetical protein
LGLSEINPFPADDGPDGIAWTILEKGGQQYRGFINRHGEFVLLQQKSQF